MVYDNHYQEQILETHHLIPTSGQPHMIKHQTILLQTSYPIHRSRDFIFYDSKHSSIMARLLMYFLVFFITLLFCKGIQQTKEFVL